MHPDLNQKSVAEYRTAVFSYAQASRSINHKLAVLNAKSALHNSLPYSSLQLAQALRICPVSIKATARASWRAQKEEQTMLWTIFVILLILWLVGIVSSYTMGGFIHLLLVIALVVLLINLISGRRPVV
jgi:hypothetical protein